RSCSPAIMASAVSAWMISRAPAARRRSTTTPRSTRWGYGRKFCRRLAGEGLRRLVARLLENLVYGFVAAPNQGIDDTGEGRPGKRRQPEQPQLLDRPSADEHRGAGAPRRVHGGIGDRDTDQMNQGQSQADGDRCEALRGA